MIVLGMHRSGTSLLARLLDEMGAYVGSDEELLSGNFANLDGYWERKDVVGINDGILWDLGADWRRVGELDLAGLSGVQRSKLQESVRGVVRNLEAQGLWMIKDPRLCLVLPLWKSVLSDPICLLMHREPLEVAASLRKRDGVATEIGVALWEKYNLSALESSVGMHRVIVSYRDLLDQPIETVATLFQRLVELGEERLCRLGEQEINEIVKPSLCHHTVESSEAVRELNPPQVKLLHALESGEALNWGEIPSLSDPSRKILLELSCNEIYISIARLEEANQKLSKDAEARERWVQELDTAVSERGQIIQDVQQELKERTKWTKDLEFAASRKDQQILSLQRHLDDKIEWGRGLERQTSLMLRRECRSKMEFSEILGSLYRHRPSLEEHVAKEHSQEEQFSMPGICEVDEMPVNFKVDRNWGARQLDNGIWLPNWRERLECPECGLNSRQRAIASLVMGDIRSRMSAGENGEVHFYMMERVTKTYDVLGEKLTGVKITGSEYLGPDYGGGQIADGIRHEDAEHLSFSDSSIDVVMSNDVLEHVSDPYRAIREVARVLKSGGHFYFSIPFDAACEVTTPRAEIVDGQIVHHEPPEYHGNPLSSEGSLVFTAFGWDFIEGATEAGFKDCFGQLFWSLEFGHLGISDLVFLARK